MFEVLTGLGLAFPAGLNAYIPLLALALANRFTNLIQLDKPYGSLSSPLVLLILAILLTVEEVADKIPIVDHVNDLVQSAIRPASGALVLMAVTAARPTINPILMMLLGLCVAGGVHAAKISFRPLVTTTTGGLGNPLVSAVEDGVAIVLTVLALVAPVVIGVLLALLALAVVVAARQRRQRRLHADGAAS